VIAETADRVAVMYSGRIVEIGPLYEVVKLPRHPYTVGLMGSIPVIGEEKDELSHIPGAMPRLQEIPPGCAFHPRCSRVFDRCRRERPELREIGKQGVRTACWLYDAIRTADDGS
jgi:peptide/nickel transport system ATP-binding protein